MSHSECYRCKYIFIRIESHEEQQYYCSYKSKERPICGSLLMGESFYFKFSSFGVEKYTPDDIEKYVRNWKNWSKDREKQKTDSCKFFEEGQHFF